jgi:hypothetical protein
MKSFLRSVAAVVLGLVAASAVMMVFESLNGRVLYPELGALARGMTDRDAIRALLATAPAGAFAVVIVGWTLGSFAGGYLTAWMAGRAPRGHAVALGTLLTLAGIANNLMVPPPLWFWVASLAVLIPAACAGGRLRSARSARSSTATSV